jgi:hypothetical protein
MTAPLKQWEVLPHGKLTQIDANILTVTGEIKMPVGELPRRMTVVRLQDHRLVIFSAIALDEDEMGVLEAFGVPAFLIVPNDHHRLDAKIWKDRYPDMMVIAPEGSCEKVSKAVSVDATDADFGDPNVRLIIVPGTRAHEAALEVTGVSGTTLVLNDIIGNIRDASGFGGWLLRIMGFAGDEPHVPTPVKIAMVKDKAALAAQLRRWADLPMLKRILVSHGALIEHDPSPALKALAATLD